MNAQRKTEPLVSLVAEATLPTRYGLFRVLGFQCSRDGLEYGVLVRGNVQGASGVPVRLHSECFTGDVMGSLRCDCRDQLELALRTIAMRDVGVVIYLRQEGRGIGLLNKIRAYALQDIGLDTVEANHALGFADDLRDYDVAGAILHALGVASVELLSNNPRKRDGLLSRGIQVDMMVPHKIQPNAHNHSYLETKKIKSGHIL